MIENKTQDEISGAKRKTKNTKNTKQKTIRERWKRTALHNKMLVFISIFGVVSGIIYTVATVCGVYFSEYHHAREHRPLVVFIRTPEFLSPLSCEITDREIHVHQFRVRVWRKNIKTEDAVGVFIVPTYKLIPLKKTGVPKLDDPPAVTDDTCTHPFLVPKDEKMFPLNAGQQISIENDSALAQSFYPQVIEPSAPMEFYAAFCAYYSDTEGRQYGTCNRYRLTLPDANVTFPCTKSLIIGILQLEPFSFCEN
jgi:hypothetical protein